MKRPLTDRLGLSVADRPKAEMLGNELAARKLSLDRPSKPVSPKLWQSFSHYWASFHAGRRRVS